MIIRDSDLSTEIHLLLRKSPTKSSKPHLRIVQNGFIDSNRTSSAAFDYDHRDVAGAAKISSINYAS